MKTLREPEFLRWAEQARDAGAATPLVIAAIESAGGTVVASREYRPSFDEVFALLVARHRRSLGRVDAVAGVSTLPQALRLP